VESSTACFPLCKVEWTELFDYYRLLDSLVILSAGLECGRPGVQSPVKDRVIPKTI